MKNKFWDNVFYKKEFVENVVKDGEVYKKYKRVKRFKKLPGIILFIVLCIVAAAVIFSLSESSLKSSEGIPPPDEVSEE